MAKFPNPTAYTGSAASESKSGVVKLANSNEVVDANNAKDAVSPKGLDTKLAQSGYVQWEDVTVSNAEIKALRASPKELVAAPAAGSVHMFLGAQLKLNYGGTNAFTETADNLAIKYENGSGVAVSDTIESTNFIDATADTLTSAVPVADAIVAASGAEAKALVLHNTGDGEIAGNAADDNTMTLRIYYVTHAL